MDLIFSAWHPSNFEGGRTVQVAANYAGYGGHTGPFRWKSTLVPQPDYDPHIPQWNRLFPIVWNEYVITPEEEHALQQAGLLQVPGQLPATYAQPGAASVSGA